MSEPREVERAALDLFERSLEQRSDARAQWIDAQVALPAAVRARAAALLRHDRETQDAHWTGVALAFAGAADPPPNAQIGAYRIRRLIGQGGMGAVYEGERATGDFDHHVAIKVIRPGLLKEALVARFERERQVLAGMDHPNIARLFDGGQLPDGAPFMVMEFVDGVPVTDYCDDHALGVAARVAVFRKVCSAVRHAHQNLIVHRDITPSNVLVNRDGEPKLIDFGIAKPDVGPIPDDVDTPIGSAARLSLASLSFTPGFVAPERLIGGATTVLSDIFSLGKLLAAMLGAAEHDRDLGAIVTLATREAPGDRYPSVDALIEDLDHHEARRPVAARAGGRRYVAARFVARNRLAVAASGAITLLLIVSLIVTTALYARAEAARRAVGSALHAGARAIELYAVRPLRPVGRHCGQYPRVERYRRYRLALSARLVAGARTARRRGAGNRDRLSAAGRHPGQSDRRQSGPAQGIRRDAHARDRPATCAPCRCAGRSGRDARAGGGALFTIGVRLYRGR